MSPETDPPDDLTPANRNRWYILMTLHGEQEGELIDWKLAEKNRRAWNAWSGQVLSAEEQERYAAAARIEVAELRAWKELKDEISDRHRAQWAARTAGANYPGLPNPERACNLAKTAFSTTVVLGKAVFSRVVQVNSAHFHSDVRMGSAQFLARAIFSSAKFQSRAYFGFAEFHAGAGFDGAQFLGDAWFSRFHAEAQFGKARFFAGAQFGHAEFDAAARFDGALFDAACRFASVRFEGPSYFTEARFGVAGSGKVCRPDFTDAAFNAPANFRQAVFLTHHPVLAGTLLHPETQITADDRHWPELPVWKGDQDPQEARECCAKLRHNLSGQGRPEDAHFFYRREMHFAERSGPVWARLPIWLYGGLSHYGHSIGLPVTWLILIWAYGGALWFRDTPTPFCPSAWEHSAANVFAFFGYLRLYFPECAQALPPALKAFSGLQTFASYLMLFFLGLGLRQRFRLR